MKRLREAQNVKVQPNKTGTSFMQGQSVYLKSGTVCNRTSLPLDLSRNCTQQGILFKNGVHFDSVADTPYNNLANSNSFTPSYTDVEKLADKMCRCVKKKEWPTDSNGRIIPKSWNFSWQRQVVS